MIILVVEAGRRILIQIKTSFSGGRGMSQSFIQNSELLYTNVTLSFYNQVGADKMGIRTPVFLD